MASGVNNLSSEINPFEKSGSITPRPIGVTGSHMMTKDDKAKFKTGDKMLELFPLRILALLVCRGTYEEKSGILFDLAVGNLDSNEEVK